MCDAVAFRIWIVDEAPPRQPTTEKLLLGLISRNRE